MQRLSMPCMPGEAAASIMRDLAASLSPASDPLLILVVVRHAAISPMRAGGMPLGLFRGVRSFTVTSMADGEVGFAMGEAYSGLLAPLITRSIPDLQPALHDRSPGPAHLTTRSRAGTV